jgi:hypothetical protein
VPHRAPKSDTLDEVAVSLRRRAGVITGGRQDITTMNGQPDCASPSTRSASPACPAPVMSSALNQASRNSKTPTVRVVAVGRSDHGTAGPSRQAPAGQQASAPKATAAKIACRSGRPPASSGLAATSIPATPPAIRISLPGIRAGRNATPVMTSQAPVIAKASVITQRSTAPSAASPLTVSLTGS